MMELFPLEMFLECAIDSAVRTIYLSPTSMLVSPIQVQIYELWVKIVMNLYSNGAQCRSQMASETIRKSRGRGVNGRRVANECVFSANENGKERKERKRGKRRR